MIGVIIFALIKNKMNIEILEKEIEKLESIENFNDKIIKTKQIREKIVQQKKKLEDLTNKMVKNEIFAVKKPKKLPTLDTMLKEFEHAKDLEEKMKYYGWIYSYITEIENELFTNN
jgi:hypothetical protein